MPTVFLRHLFRSALLLFAIDSAVAATTCPAGQHEVCMLTCFCAPGTREEMGALYDSVGQMAASGLESWLVQSRNTAAAGDVRPIPLNIRVQLEDYFDLQVLETARYKVGDATEFNAANTMLQNPDVQAVTLVDIIVFRSEEAALNDVALWAHELVHVQQYQQWGVAEFAKRYSRDYDSVEAPGYAMQRQVTAALKAAAAPATPVDKL